MHLVLNSGLSRTEVMALDFWRRKMWLDKINEILKQQSTPSDVDVISF
jgi:hypothetical protein